MTQQPPWQELVAIDFLGNEWHFRRSICLFCFRPLWNFRQFFILASMHPLSIYHACGCNIWDWICLRQSNAVDFPALCWTCMGTMMVAASANSLNQVFEINNDAKMKRTSKRPLPSGHITIPHAVNWASSVGLAGTALIATKANMLAAGLAASNLVLYAFVYTPLKQIHLVNTWVGAVVGAVGVNSLQDCFCFSNAKQLSIGNCMIATTSRHDCENKVKAVVY
ncbi:hypothetical protein K1719_027884 [Acacia pycnantha]|nr:hypothetical protein K1719_027884 [Acacia pycnantha]